MSKGYVWELAQSVNLDSKLPSNSITDILITMLQSDHFSKGASQETRIANSIRMS